MTLLTNEDDIQKIDEARREAKRGRTRDQVVMAHADTQLAYIGVRAGKSHLWHDRNLTHFIIHHTHWLTINVKESSKNIKGSLQSWPKKCVLG